MAKPKVISTQQYLKVAEIKNGIVILKNGSLRLILAATPINFALKSEQEQNSIIGQYQGFLNALRFPVQIVIQSKRLDLNPYLTSLEKRLEKIQNDLLKAQAADYIEFIKRLIKIANIMQKRFYIVLSYSPPPTKQATGLVGRLLHRQPETSGKITQAEFKSYTEELKERANTVINGLGSLGVQVTSLSTMQVIELLYNIYNPEEATAERITAETIKGQVPIVGKKTTAPPPQEKPPTPTQAPPAPQQPPAQSQSPQQPPQPKAPTK